MSSETSRSEQTLAFGEMNRETLETAAGTALLVIPVGATEQHGPGMPTLTDSLHTDAVSGRAARLAADEIPVVVAPTMPYGCSAHHLPFGATLSLDSETLIRVLLDLGESAVQSGFRIIFFLNGHGGNREVVQLAARDLALSTGCQAGGGSWWAMARQDLLSVEGVDPSNLPGHGGDFEGSIVRALGASISESATYDSKPAQPEPVPNAPYRAEFSGLWELQDGYSDDPRQSSATRGEEYLAVAAESVARHLVDFYREASRLAFE